MAESYTLATWTSDSLAAHVRGILNVDPNASGGTVPDRLLQTTIAAGVELWNRHDWRFRIRTATLTVAADASTADLATDFGELYGRWWRDAEEQSFLKFYDDAMLWQRQADLFDVDDGNDDGKPQHALITRKTATTTSFAWHVQFERSADQEYKWPYWYMAASPWLSATFADSSEVIWPITFHEGWRLLAAQKALEDYGKNDEAKLKLRQYAGWLKQQKAENDEMISVPNAQRMDGYKDFQGHTRVFRQVRNYGG